MTKPFRTALFGLFLILAAGCATVPRDPAARAEFKANNDPIEPFNRKVFALNVSADKVLIKPLAKGYRWALPGRIRDAIRHVLDNLNEPLVMANCILQGRAKSAVTTGGRFVVNSTVGAAGIADVATGMKLRKQVGDFGQTLWAWGVPEGPYLIIPIFGPSSPRDGLGRAVDVYLDPFRYVPGNYNYPDAVTTGRIVADGVDQRSRNLDSLDEIQRESIDYYASLRSLYRQNRAAELRDGKPLTTLPPADFYDDPGR
ncbi:MAG: VacJ family lipoprotein [Opitutaceae bacterium]|jgi:phospholipid-binding lipoprotein MlaA